eukprot:scaffold1139_cov136-Isochrysis_galbana.AAC.4
MRIGLAASVAGAVAAPPVREAGSPEKRLFITESAGVSAAEREGAGGIPTALRIAGWRKASV